MIKLKELSWNNAFSYANDNTINFENFPLVQLLGKNGHGKSSIALILEEVLFNKNSKNIKKSDILNRYVKDKKYSISLTFSKDNDIYQINTVRGTTQTVTLLYNDEDISAHTATATYKLIEEILGFDHKTFTQIVYQSSSASLEFLTATDTTRKKFLIDLLNLSIYNRGSDLFKGLLKGVTNELEVVDLKIKTINDWLTKFSKEDLTEKILLEVPDNPIDNINELTEVKHQLYNIESTNKKITQNNTYRSILNNIDISTVNKPETDLKLIEAKSSKLLHQLSDIDATIRGTGTIKDTCNACGQPIDNTHKKLIKQEATAKKLEVTAEFNKVNEELRNVTLEWSKYDKYISNKIEWEKYYGLIDRNIPSTLLDRTELENRAKLLDINIANITKDINRITTINTAAIAHNTKVSVILEQMDSMRNELSKLTSISAEIHKKATILQLLVKTFSTTGLVAYKIECLVKDLEELTNKYLIDMSDGRFQLSFKINSSDKLNVIISDNGNDIDILALSNGERARVNVSTLLAIRKLMQSLSNSRINLLILDETIETLDIEGKERLIEVLLKEESLNTVLVSHSFTHPLIEKINIVKENNISRIE